MAKSTVGIVQIVGDSFEDAAARKWTCNKRYTVIKEGKIFHLPQDLFYFFWSLCLILLWAGIDFLLHDDDAEEEEEKEEKEDEEEEVKEEERRKKSMRYS